MANTVNAKFLAPRRFTYLKRVLLLLGNHTNIWSMSCNGSWPKTAHRTVTNTNASRESPNGSPHDRRFEFVQKIIYAQTSTNYVTICCSVRSGHAT